MTFRKISEMFIALSIFENKCNFSCPCSCDYLFIKHHFIITGLIPYRISDNNQQCRLQSKSSNFADKCKTVLLRGINAY